MSMNGASFIWLLFLAPFLYFLPTPCLLFILITRMCTLKGCFLSSPMPAGAVHEAEEGQHG